MIAALALAIALSAPGVPVLVTGARGASTPVVARIRIGREADPHVLNIDFFEFAGRHIVRRYDLDMTKLMHLIVVSDDLRTFMHVHPVLGLDGHFRLRLHLPRAQFVHLFADGVPHGLGRQIFRFDVRAVLRSDAAVRRLPPATTHSQAGLFVATLSRDTIPIGEAAIYTLTVARDGKPASGLHPYLGAMGHGVLIGERDLSYMHVHAMDAMMMQMMGTDDCGDAILTMIAPVPPDTQVPPTVQFFLQAPRAGPYAFWYQFRAGNRDYVAPFVLTAR